MRKPFFWAAMLLASLLLLTMPALAANQGDTVELKLSITSEDAYFVQVEYAIDENVFEFVGVKPDLGSMSRKGFAAVRVDKPINADVGIITLRVKDNAPDGEYTIKPTVKAAYRLDEGAASAQASFSTVQVGKEQPKEVVIDGGKYLLNPDRTASFLAPADEKATSITIPAKVSIKVNKKKVDYTVTSIAPNACKSMASLKKVTIGKNVKIIGTNAFCNCAKLAEVSFVGGGPSLKTIDDSAFQKCTSLTEFTITKNVTKIGKNALKDCKNLATINVKPKKLTKKNIGSGAFKNISSTASFVCESKKIAASYKPFFIKTGGAPKKGTWKSK